MDDLISRQAALALAKDICVPCKDHTAHRHRCIGLQLLMELPIIQLEKEIPKRVLWTGWKGYRDTRYKCPNCKKPVKNDDVYCHRCGQKLMFPHVDWTPYVEGQKQELIVRWDDE